jgi:two-component system, NarL family, response regulator NreC
VCPNAQIHREGGFPLRKIRCVLVHEHVLLRQGLRRLLEDEPDFEVVSEAGNAAEALQRVLEYGPEAVIADANALGLSASDAEAAILGECPQSRVFFLTTEERTDSGFRYGRIQGAGWAARETSGKELAEMVRSICRTGRAGVRQMPLRGEPARHTPEPLLSRKRLLTAREREILKLLAEGRTVRSVAGLLGVSVKTVDAHKFNLMRKLGIHNKAELVMWAIQKRMVKIPANF